MAILPHKTLLFITLTYFSISTTPQTLAYSSPSPSSLLKTYKTFIKTSCNSTTYSSLCYKSLSPYASSIQTNPLNLCYSALNVTINAARETSTMVSELAKQNNITSIEASAISDCIENTEDSVYELQDSLEAMYNLEGDDKEYILANAKTWVSAAITDEDTCMDGFNGRKVSSSDKKMVKNGVVGVMRLGSIALSLINSLQY